MKAFRTIREQIVKLGYAAIEKDYAFSDVFAATNPNRVASLAAFTNTPTSYRNAALAVVEANGRSATELTNDFRALGAPLLFVVSDDAVRVWKVTASGAQREVAHAALDQLEALFSRHAESWAPGTIHRAKSIGLFNSPAQLDFVDAGLLPAIEGEVHSKLDLLLNQMLAEAVGLRNGRTRYQLDQRLLFRTIFRLLAAKVLEDREHELSKTWDATSISSVLRGISAYYTLVALPGEQSQLQSTMFSSSSYRAASSDGALWIGELTKLWEWLSGSKTLGDVASAHRGIEWPAGQQTAATSLSPKRGYRTSTQSTCLRCCSLCGRCLCRLWRARFSGRHQEFRAHLRPAPRTADHWTCGHH